MRDSEIVPGIKNRHTENFPVASWLIEEPYRVPMGIFYDFARAADDIADHPDWSDSDKIRRLEGYRAAFLGGDNPGYPTATACHYMMMEHEIPLQHGLDLLKAFFIDVQQKRCASWVALTTYCQFSAAPVGRFVLDLHDEDPDLWPAADLLCQVLQILNHVQDMGADYRQLGRIYLPQDWMHQAGVMEKMLLAPCLSAPLRVVVDQVLDGLETMLKMVHPLSSKIYSRRLAAEIRVIDRLAWIMLGQLRRGDPLTYSLKPGKTAFIRAGLAGLSHYAARIFR